MASIPVVNCFVTNLPVQKVRVMAFLLCGLLLNSCAQTGSVKARSDGVPQWVSGEPALYPNFKYLYATGSAVTAETAENRALSNLAKIFEVQIRQSSTTYENVESRRQNGAESVKQSQQLSRTLNVRTKKRLNGARIAEQWKNPDDGSYFALAILDRAQAGNNLRQQMQRLDKKTEFVLQQSSHRENPLLKIADLNSARQLQQKRQALQKTLKIIDLKGRGIPSRWNLAVINARMYKALRTLPLRTAIIKDNIGGLGEMLQGAASEAGFNLGDVGYQLTATMTAEPPFRQAGWYWLRGTLKLTLISTNGQNLLGYKSWPLKVSALNQIQLKNRMKKSIDKKLRQSLFRTVLAFVDR